jgi:hypothetical protein
MIRMMLGRRFSAPEAMAQKARRVKSRGMGGGEGGGEGAKDAKEAKETREGRD